MSVRGTPSPAITETGKLPPGVRFKAHTNGTATIAGTPRSSRKQVYRIKLTAANHYGIAVQAFTLTVTRHPCHHG